MAATLIVRSRGTALVVNYEALEAGARRFIGRKHDPKLGSNGGWPPDSEPHTVPDRAEYRLAMREGDLWPGDQATADLVGVEFDPTFGGELAPDAPRVLAPATKSEVK